MGNILGLADEDPNSNHQRQQQQQQQQQEERHEHTSPLSHKELDSVKHLFETWNAESGGGNIISREVFGAHFVGVPFLGDVLAASAAAKSHGAFTRFVEVAVRPMNSLKNTEMLWQLVSKWSTQGSRSSGESTLRVFWTIVLNCSRSDRDSNDKAIDASSVINLLLHKAQLEDETLITWTHLSAFINEFAPATSLVLVTFFSETFFPFEEKSPTFVPFKPVALVEGSSVVSSGDVIPLALYSSALQASWRRMYSSSTDGYAFEHILRAITGYSGPTLFLIKVRIPRSATDKTPVIFGVAVFDRWTECSKFYGCSSNFLFSLSPELRIYRSIGNESNYQFLTTKTFNKATHGIAFGGSADLKSKRIFVPSSLEDCVVTSGGADLTYEGGPLVPPRAVRDDGLFDIDTLEIFAVGGQQAIAEGMKSRNENRTLASNTRERARKVDKGAFVDHLAAYGEATFEHRQQVDNR